MPRKYIPLTKNIGMMMKAATPTSVKRVAKSVASVPKKVVGVVKRKAAIQKEFRNKNSTYAKFKGSK